MRELHLLFSLAGREEYGIKVLSRFYVRSVFWEQGLEKTTSVGKNHTWKWGVKGLKSRSGSIRWEWTWMLEQRRTCMSRGATRQVRGVQLEGPFSEGCGRSSRHPQPPLYQNRLLVRVSLSSTLTLRFTPTPEKVSRTFLRCLVEVFPQRLPEASPCAASFPSFQSCPLQDREQPGPPFPDFSWLLFLQTGSQTFSGHQLLLNSVSFPGRTGFGGPQE